MTRHVSPNVGLLTIMLCAVAAPVHAQLDEHTQWALDLSRQYRIYSNIPYLTANNLQVKLDIYRPLGAEGPRPTVIYFHGGGWVGGSKEGAAFQLMPYLANGFVAVNVQYRLGRVSLAPAAVEDTRCALRWVLRNAEDYDIDTSRIIVTGHSAGGHLALTTGMLPASVGLDRQCVGLDDVSVAGPGVRYRSNSTAKQPEDEKAFSPRSGCTFISASKEPTARGGERPWTGISDWTLLTVARDRVRALVAEGKTLEETLAADPTAGLYTRGEPWLPVGMFVRLVYAEVAWFDASH